MRTLPQLKRELQDKEMQVSSKSYLALHVEAEQLRTEVEGAREQKPDGVAKSRKWKPTLPRVHLQALEQEKSVETLVQEHQRGADRTQTLEFQIRELNFEIEQARRNKEMTGSMLEQSQARKIRLGKRAQAGGREPVERERSCR